MPDADLLKKSSDRLCSALAAFAPCLCTERLESGHLTAFTAARLIPLDRKPGVRDFFLSNEMVSLVSVVVVVLILGAAVLLLSVSAGNCSRLYYLYFCDYFFNIIIDYNIITHLHFNISFLWCGGVLNRAYIFLRF